jgi:uncharacterized 2Fe-2S/4Fe-4S cluster protein (DUF4445 family)
MTIIIDFEPIGRRGPCAEGDTLLECARTLGVDLENLCGGAGSCGSCKVQVLAGQVSEVTDADEEFLTEQELAEGYRLACRAVPRSDCKVRVPPESLTAPQRTQVEGEEIPVAADPAVRAYAVQVPPPGLEDLRADVERLAGALREQHGVEVTCVDLEVLRELSPTLRQQKWQVHAALRGGELIALLPYDGRQDSQDFQDSHDHKKDPVNPENPVHPVNRSSLLGLAVDLGTTKIACYLLDLASGATLAAQGLMNPQIAYGEDVIARMSYATEAPAQAERIQAMVADTLNGAAAQMCAEVGADPRQIVEAVVVGNTAMHHLFLRLPTEQLALAPYVPAVRSALDVKARDAGLRLAPGANLHLLPNIAGYVGADHVAMLLAVGMHRRQGLVLALDIGTNTEVCLADNGRLISLSCASGPAFEGAHIRHGMRASEGAIEHLRLTEDRLEIQTIGGQPPVGLCGSGILDALAQLRLAGVVDVRGRMHPHARVREANGVREFVIAGEEADGRPPVTFTQIDVRELQLAKGAMRTGVQVLLETAGRRQDEIDEVIIAGAFGTYIDVGSAIEVGMLPPLPRERFRQVGNAAGMGAKLALISQAQRAEAAALAAGVGYVELAAAPGFHKVFAESMMLSRDLFQ